MNKIALESNDLEKIDNLSEVPLDTHIRYLIVKPDGTHVPRMGGFLTDKTFADEFIVLSNGTYTWTVNTKNNIFFKKISKPKQIIHHCSLE